jgi:hypothetical protein
VKKLNLGAYNKTIREVKNYLINIKDFMPELDNHSNTYTCTSINKLIQLLKTQLKEQDILLLIASKKIPYQNELNQELEYIKYFIVYLIIALKVLNRGGTLILRTYDNHLPITCTLIFLLHMHFEQVTIIKPLSSNLHSAERFIMAKDLLEEEHEELVVTNEMKEKVVVSITEYESFEPYKEFKAYMMDENCHIEEWRIHTLSNLLEFARHPNKEIGGKDELKDRCLKLWGVPILRPYNMKAKVTNFLDEKSEDEKDEFIVSSLFSI